MRAEGEISKEIFAEKTAETKSEMAKLTAEIQELELKMNSEPVIEDYTEKLTVLRYALEQYTNADDEDIPDSVIEAYVVKIVASKDGFEWYLRFDGDPNDPLRLKTEGKRRTNSSVSTVGESSPTIHRNSTRR